MDLLHSGPPKVLLRDQWRGMPLLNQSAWPRDRHWKADGELTKESHCFRLVGWDSLAAETDSLWNSGWAVAKPTWFTMEGVFKGNNIIIHTKLSYNYVLFDRYIHI